MCAPRKRYELFAVGRHALLSPKNLPLHMSGRRSVKMTNAVQLAADEGL